MVLQAKKIWFFFKERFNANIEEFFNNNNNNNNVYKILITKCAHEGLTFLVFTAKKPNKPIYYFIFVELDIIKIFKIN